MSAITLTSIPFSPASLVKTRKSIALSSHVYFLNFYPIIAKKLSIYGIVLKKMDGQWSPPKAAIYDKTDHNPVHAMAF